MINISLEDVKSGINTANTNGKYSYVFRNAVDKNPSWDQFIAHVNEQAHNEKILPEPLNIPFIERQIRGITLKSLFYIDARLPNPATLGLEATEIYTVFNEALGNGTFWPVSVFFNVIGNEYSIPTHSDDRHTIHWQCQGTSHWTIYPPADENGQYDASKDHAVADYVLNPGDVIYLPHRVRHFVKITEPRASIAFGYHD